jgi:hypothetical protein
MNFKLKNKPVKNWWLELLGSPYSIFMLTLIIGAFYILTLHEGHNWGDDFAQYIHHAKNLVEGKPYSDTGVISTSAANFVGPNTYPPVFPILLAPVYWFYGLDLEAMKIVGILCFCLTLMMLPRVFGCQLNRLQQISIIALTGFNPALWESRNHILSDFTFLLFSYLSLHLMLQAFHQDHHQHRNARQTIINSWLIGIAMYLAYGTREVGIVLPIVVLTYEIISTRKITFISIISISIFSILLLLQHFLLQGNFTPAEIQNNLRELAINSGRPIAYSHLDFISLEPHGIAKRLQGYRWVFESFWGLWPPSENRTLGNLTLAISTTTVLMAFIGLCLTLSKKITVLEIFFVGNVAVLLLFGAPPTLRYLFPLFPLTLYYCVVAYQQLLATNRFQFKAGIPIIYLSITTILYGHAMYNHSHQGVENRVIHPNSYAAITNGITHPKSVEMFNFIRNNTSPSDTIICRKPRVMALLTQRASAGYPQSRSHSAEFIDRFFDAVAGDYYVDDDLGNPLTHSEAPTARFSEVFRNANFAIYRYNQSVGSRVK